LVGRQETELRSARSGNAQQLQEELLAREADAKSRRMHEQDLELQLTALKNKTTAMFSGIGYAIGVRS
jgi:hypothetical protein